MSKDFDDESPEVTIARLRSIAEAAPWGWPGTIAFIWFWTLVAVVILGCVYLNNARFWQ